MAEVGNDQHKRHMARSKVKEITELNKIANIPRFQTQTLEQPLKT